MNAADTSSFPKNTSNWVAINEIMKTTQQNCEIQPSLNASLKFLSGLRKTLFASVAWEGKTEYFETKARIRPK